MLYHYIAKAEITPTKRVTAVESPNSFYSCPPSWRFSSRDTEKWAFTKEAIGETIWDEIIPKLQDFEKQTWSEILVDSSKQNHGLAMKDLNKEAQAIIIKRQLELESIISLRLQGKHRLYGYIYGSTFHVLWYDEDHGDNDYCVCRSYKKIHKN